MKRVLLGRVRSRSIAVLLRQYRENIEITQEQAAVASRVGSKTISSFECDLRTESIELRQLLALLDTYGVSLEDFARDLERQISSRTQRSPDLYSRGRIWSARL